MKVTSAALAFALASALFTGVREAHAKPSKETPSFTTVFQSVLKDKATPDLSRARAQFASACERDDAQACVEAANIAYFGHGGPLDVGTARKLFGRACDLGEPKGCYSLGKLEWKGIGGPKSEEEALAHFEKACEAGSGQECALASSLFSSLDAEFGQVRERSRAYAERACQKGVEQYCMRRINVDVATAASECAGGNMASCVAAGTAYWKSSTRMENTTRKARDLFKLACDEDYAAGCASLAFLLWEVDGSTSVEADGLAKKACSLGSAHACSVVGRRELERSKQREGRLHLLKGCVLGSIGCSLLGENLQKEIRAKPLVALAESYSERACWYELNVGCNAANIRGSKAELARLDKTCETIDAGACARAGAFILASKRSPYITAADKAEAAKRVQKGCDKRDAASCGLFARHLVNGDGVPQDKERAIRLFKQACEGDDSFGCAVVAQLMERGEEIPRDIPVAIEMYKKSCSLKLADGCAGAARLYYNGTDSVAQDLAKAKRYFDAACALKDLGETDAVLRSCTMSRSLAERVGKAQDDASKCETSGDAEACLAAASAYTYGDGANRNPDKASTLFRTVCEMPALPGQRVDKGAVACFQLAELAAGSDAAVPLRRSCERKFALGCWVQACNGGDSSGCVQAADAFRWGLQTASFSDVSGLLRTDQRRADTLYAEACEIGSADMCFQIGEMYRTGAMAHSAIGRFVDPKSASPRAAVAFYERACERGNMAGCSFAGDVHRTGIDGVVDKDKASHFYDRACKGGRPEACVSKAIVGKE